MNITLILISIINTIKICVLNYLYLFGYLFHYSLEIILKSVEGYFIIFQNIFLYSLDIFLLIINKLLEWPNNILTCIFVNTLLFWGFCYCYYIIRKHNIKNKKSIHYL